MRFRPCIDIHDGKVKQIVGSTLADGAVPVTNFETQLSPAHFAQLYQRDKLPGGHVIMLGKGNEAAARSALEAYPGGLQVGGGITPESAPQFLSYGASHVIVTSYVFRNGVLDRAHLAEMSRIVGRERLVLDVSCKKRGDGYVIVTDRWQNETRELLTEALFAELSRSCDEFLVHAAHVEGMKKGIDAELVALLHQCTDCPITYAGGVRCLDDLALVRESGGDQVDITIGSALDIFGGTLAYGEVVNWFNHAGGVHEK